MSQPSFALRIYQSEYNEIRDFVLKYPNIETGGDLFGLWTSNADPVVQLLIGPGQKCRRTSVSFHQDTEYLANVGRFVNSSYMLCHLGSWHSHHQLSLDQPSAGDRSTVCNHFPAGLERYIMIIVNIVVRDTISHSVELHPYMFTEEGHVCEPGSVELINLLSPFRENDCILKMISENAEPEPRQPHNPRREYSRHFSPESRSLSPEHQTVPRSRTLKNDAEEKQWYSSPKGREKLTKIHKDVLRILENDPRNSATEVDFSRNVDSFNLLLTFRHNNVKWSIEFPKDFGEEKAIISYTNDDIRKYSSQIDSFDVAQAIQNNCACENCGNLCKRSLKQNAVKRNEEIVNDSERKTRGNTQKLLSKKGSETLTRASNERNFGERNDFSQNSEEDTSDEKSEENDCDSREVSFTTTKNYNKKLHKIAHISDGNQSFTSSEMSVQRESESEDKTLSEECMDYLTDDDESQTENQNNSTGQWYESQEGNEKLVKLNEDIKSLLNAKNIDFKRDKVSKNLEMSFEHNNSSWSIQFPKFLNKERVKINRLPDFSENQPVFYEDIVKTVQELCLCQECNASCKDDRYGETANGISLLGEENDTNISKESSPSCSLYGNSTSDLHSSGNSVISTNLDTTRHDSSDTSKNSTPEKQSSDSSSPQKQNVKQRRQDSRRKKHSPYCRPKGEKVSVEKIYSCARADYFPVKPKTGDPESGPSAKNNQEQKKTSSNDRGLIDKTTRSRSSKTTPSPKPTPSPKSSRTASSPTSPRRKIDQGHGSSNDESQATKEANEIIEKLCKYLNERACDITKPPGSSYIPGTLLSLSFTHNSVEWFVDFPKSFPTVRAKLFKKDNEHTTRSFCDFISPSNTAITTFKRCCGCYQCAKIPKKKRKSGPYPKNQKRSFESPD